MSSKHQIKWWAHSWNRDGVTELLPAKSYMRVREGWVAWDATCSCGWKTRTGGAIKSYITKQIRWHKLNEED